MVIRFSGMLLLPIAIIACAITMRRQTRLLAMHRGSYYTALSTLSSSSEDFVAEEDMWIKQSSADEEAQLVNPQTTN